MPTLHHLALRTRELRRLEQFYIGVMSAEVVRRDQVRGSVWLAVGDVVLMLERASAEEPTVAVGSLDLLAFAADEQAGGLAAWRARLQQAQIAVEHATEHTLYFRDPDGRRVGVSTFRWPWLEGLDQS
jgi:catechol-2,3-dioxygenase